MERAALDDDQVAAACTLAARLIGVDLDQAVHVDEDRVRARISLALGQLSPVIIETERSVPVTGFRGVGPIDILVRDLIGATTGLIEVKWSVDPKRDKIFEAPWDAVKLVLADVPDAKRWLITGAPDVS